jgi:hypothetical protein
LFVGLLMFSSPRAMRRAPQKIPKNIPKSATEYTEYTVFQRAGFGKKNHFRNKEEFIFSRRFWRKALDGIGKGL